jgi:fucokinase
MTGWSDTPPICYEMSGSVSNSFFNVICILCNKNICFLKVLNVAVNVDGLRPISCASRVIVKPIITLHSLKPVLPKDDIQGGKFGYEGSTVDCINQDDILDASNLASSCALLKAVLIVLEVVNKDNLHQSLMTRFGGGLEIAIVSTLPAGSGLGGSSILAASALISVSTLLGLNCSPDKVMYQVLQVEQVLTTGGGWQDQLGCLYGGFKIGRSLGHLPLRISTEVFPSLPKATLDCLERRMVLVYTGQQRLAKNTLMNALRQYATASSDNDGKYITIVNELIKGAEQGAQLLLRANNLSSDDFVNSLGEIVSRFV